MIYLFKLKKINKIKKISNLILFRKIDDNEIEK